MNEKTDKQIKDELDAYLVQFPDEMEINATIHTLRQYVPEKQTKRNQIMQRFKRLVQQAQSEVFFMGKAYWIISIILFIIGYVVTILGEYNPVITLILLTPAPFVIGLFEVFKSRDQGLLEMEMACKFSANEVMLARLLIISLFNLIINTIFTLAFSPFIQTTTLFHVTLLWLTPFTLFMAVALWLSMKTRDSRLTFILFPIWSLFTFQLLTDVKRGPILLNMHIGIYLILLAIGIILLLSQVHQLMKNYATFEMNEQISVQGG